MKNCFENSNDKLTAFKTRPRSYKTFFMLDSVEHEILNGHEYKILRNSFFLGSDKTRMLFSLTINVKMQKKLLAF